MARRLLKATDGCGCPRGLEEPDPLCPGAEQEAMSRRKWEPHQQEERGERNERRKGE